MESDETIDPEEVVDGIVATILARDKAWKGDGSVKAKRAALDRRILLRLLRDARRQCEEYRRIINRGQ